MARSILIPCGRCGYENLPQHRFCGMCGFPLPTSAGTETQSQDVNVAASPDIHEFLTPVSTTDAGYTREARDPALPVRRDPGPASPPFLEPRPLPERRPSARAQSEPVNTVSGPSFLGLTTESNPDRDGASYLLEDEQTSSHKGRLLVVLLFLVAMGAAVWHWRQQVGNLGTRLTNPQQTAAQPAAGAPMSTSPSEVSPAAQTMQPGEPPKSGVTDLPPASPQNPVSNGSAPAQSSNQQNPPPTAPPDNSTAQPDSAQAPAETKDTSAASTTKSPAADAANPASDEAPDAEKAMEQQAAKRTASKRAVKATAQSSAAPSENLGSSTEAEGEKYLYGNGVPQDCNRAQRSLLAAAGQSDAKAQSVLGTMYATGHCAPRDLPVAYRWFAKALHQDPNNDRLAQDLRVLWNQMTPDERQLAVRSQ